MGPKYPGHWKRRPHKPLLRAVRGAEAHGGCLHLATRLKAASNGLLRQAVAYGRRGLGCKARALFAGPASIGTSRNLVHCVAASAEPSGRDVLPTLHAAEGSL